VPSFGIHPDPATTPSDGCGQCVRTKPPFAAPPRDFLSSVEFVVNDYVAASVRRATAERVHARGDRVDGLTFRWGERATAMRSVIDSFRGFFLAGVTSDTISLI